MLIIRDKPFSQLKPGQKTVQRDYYQNVTTEKADGAEVLSNYGRF
jgi:hypothetical protein